MTPACTAAVQMLESSVYVSVPHVLYAVPPAGQTNVKLPDRPRHSTAVRFHAISPAAVLPPTLQNPYAPYPYASAAPPTSDLPARNDTVPAVGVIVTVPPAAFVMTPECTAAVQILEPSS